MAAPSPIGRRAALTLALWLGALVAGLAIAWRAHYVADLSAFLPAAPTPEQAVLLDQLKNGATARLILIAIDGAPANADVNGDAMRRRSRARRHIAPACRRAARQRAVRLGRERRARRLGRRRQLRVRAPLSAEPGGRRGALQRHRPARCDRRDRGAARHAGRLAAQADPLSRPDRRDGAHRRGADAGARAEDRERRLGRANDAARAAARDDPRRRRRPRRPAARPGGDPLDIRCGRFARPAPAGLGRGPLRRRIARAHQGRGRAARPPRLGGHRRSVAARLRVAARTAGRAGAGRDRGRRRHRRGQPGVRPGARHDARLRHDADRRGGRLRDLLPGPGARRPGIRASAGAARAGRPFGSASSPR